MRSVCRFSSFPNYFLRFQKNDFVNGRERFPHFLRRLMSGAKKELLRWDRPVAVDDPEQGQKRKSLAATAGVDQMTREVVNSLFPPTEFTEGGVRYTQQVSINSVGKSDVQKLRTQLTNLLAARTARPTGVCLIRSDIYSQCFDEVVRQVTVDNSARGRLLSRVREHYRMMVHAHKELYATTLDWGTRKMMQVGLGIPELHVYHNELRERRRTLELQANDLQIKLENLEKKLAEMKSLREKDRADEIAFLKRQGQMTKAQIDMIVAQNPK
jgi:dynein light intermediate chain